MYKRTITYTDYNGNERTEDYYFNLSTSELTKKELTTPGGYGTYLQNVAKSGDITAILEAFNEIIDMSYGQKSDDGKRFVKSFDITDAFKQSPAYDEFIMSLIADPNAASDFINSVIPDVSRFNNQNGTNRELGIIDGGSSK